MILKINPILVFLTREIRQNHLFIILLLLLFYFFIIFWEMGNLSKFDLKHILV